LSYALSYKGAKVDCEDVRERNIPDIAFKPMRRKKEG